MTGQLTAAPRGTHPTAPNRPRTIFCLPYAGGGASAYTGLLRELATDAAVTPLQLPGRENRITEPPAFTIGGITDEIAPATGEPYALYGHSMGARIAFEVTRELRRRGLPPPARLYVGGAHPPHRKVPLAATADLPDEAFIDQLVRRAGALVELKHEPELRELLLPVLRADFTWINDYRYVPEPPLDVPIVAFTGLDDGEVSAADMLGWARHTTAGFGLRTLRGGHFFVKDVPADLARLIAADLAGRSAPPDPDEVHLLVRQPRADAIGGQAPGTRQAEPGADVQADLQADVQADVHRRTDAAGNRRAGLDGWAGMDAVRPGLDGWASVSRAGDLSLAAACDAPAGVAIALLGPPPSPPAGPWHPPQGPGTQPASRPHGSGSAPADGRRAGHMDPAHPPADLLGPAELLSDAEREQIEDAAEEDRHWLELRAVTAKRALVAAAGRDAARASFPDLADPGPWHAQDGPGPPPSTRWQVLHLPLHTTRGEALAAVAVPYDTVRLRLDTQTEDTQAPDTQAENAPTEQAG
ncbi:thioesterase domain-containing protein [Nonomuraea muscovyensis]|uniref:thioesterase domain-containing protein n=1 Tax=Nonomuraea muscovyensis TaxID=1124761 RepID=UPI0033F6394E